MTHDSVSDMVRRNRAISQEMYGPTGEHDHEWGPTKHAFLTGNPHRKCQVDGCRWVSLDLEDDDDDEDAS